MSEQNNYEHYEYSRGAIERALLNWSELEEATDERLVIVRADLELAIGFLSRRDRRIANTVLMEGQNAFTCGAVKPYEWQRLIGRIFRRLNILGLADEEETK